MKNRLFVLFVSLFAAISVYAQPYVNRHKCGAHLTYSISLDGVLSIEGTGEMDNYSSVNDVPWHEQIASIRKLNIGAEVTSIGDYAFYECKRLQAVNIPEGVQSIGNYAFGETNIYSLTVGSNVTKVGTSINSKPKKTIWYGEYPPTGFENLQGEINYVSNKLYGTTDNFKVYPFLKTDHFEVNGIIYAVYDPSQTICDAIDCSYNDNARNISIGKTVIYQDPSDTQGKDVIKFYVRQFMPYACYGNTNISTIDISRTNEMLAVYNNTVGDIGDYTFYGCTGVTNVNLDVNGKIGKYAFAGCSDMSTCDMTGSNSNSSVTAIEDHAFENCSSLREITIPNTTVSIGNYAFHGCKELENINLGNHVRTIGDHAMDSCISLRALIIPPYVTYIGDYALSNCSNVSLLVIQDRFSKSDKLYLGSNDNRPIFNDCKLDSVYIGSVLSYNTSVKYGFSPFTANLSLRAVKLGYGEEQIWENEFRGCKSLENVVIGDGVKRICSNAFAECPNLRSFAIGNGIKNIDQEAFKGCTQLVSFSCNSSTPPVCGKNVFSDVPRFRFKVKVPLTKDVYAYKQHDPWKNFYIFKNADIQTIYTAPASANAKQEQVIDGTTELKQKAVEQTETMEKDEFTLDEDKK